MMGFEPDEIPSQLPFPTTVTCAHNPTKDWLVLDFRKRIFESRRSIGAPCATSTRYLGIMRRLHRIYAEMHAARNVLLDVNLNRRDAVSTLAHVSSLGWLPQ